MSLDGAVDQVRDRSALVTRGLRLEYATLGWNVVGCVIVLVAAYTARSVALAGFGIDSVIEIFASVVVVWQLKAINEDRERLAERLIGIAFLLLAIYLTIQSAIVLITRFHAQTSVPGIIWLALTFTAMLLLAYGKGRTGQALGNPVLLKESRVTVVDGILAGSVLIGIALNALAGWWWADPLAALVIVVYGLREGYGALRPA
ncbi:MAG TPA: cation transporter [Chloroflexota bacterium]|nr:cation transporter [Chloroflexota bacterium]